MCCAVPPCFISLLCSLCPVPAGSVERLQTRISRLEDDLANSRKDNNLLTEQIAEEKIKNSKMEVEKQEAVAKVLVEKASELAAEYSKGFNQAEALMTRCMDRMMPAKKKDGGDE